jgi:hypothetical protein
LKFKEIDKAQNIFKHVVSKINNWCGENHPILILIFSVLAQYYLSIGNYDEALNYSKNSLSNCCKLVGITH